MSRLILIDGNAVMHRAFHALPPLTTRSGEPINAVYGLVSMLLKIVGDLSPTHIAFCFDCKEPTFRKKEFKEYQAHRPEMDEELSSQFEKAQRVIEAFGIPVYSKAGFEADDLIGTLARKAEIEEVIIVTGDRDILQLVDDKVKVFMPTRGLSEGQIFGRFQVEEKMGVPPNRIVDYKALVGDASDNYSGVPGIGPKTAGSLLRKYGTFTGVYNNIEKISPSTREKLEKGRKSGELSLKLARIVTDVDINFSVGDMANWSLENPRAQAVLEDLGFESLVKRLKKDLRPSQLELI